MRRNKSTRYRKVKAVNEQQVLEQAAEIIEHHYLRGDVFTNPEATKDYIKYKLGRRDREVFAVMFLDNQHQLLEFKVLFLGTIDAASIYPREVVKAALEVNAAAVILAHNHPSGDSKPSNADKRITRKLTDALALVDIRVLDHIVVGRRTFSFAERGLL